MLKKQKSGEITKAEYDEWRYQYPDGISFGTKSNPHDAPQE